MLRHFKMELRRQQELEQEHGQLAQCDGVRLQTSGQEAAGKAAAVALNMNMKPRQQQQQREGGNEQQQQQPVKRVRGRRSSKPQMEKRRRARINECLDILKSYVLTDSTNLSRLGIELTGSENQDEETIARTLLKSSGLIHRHRGRKNPNKLEKADILELTVDYVRRLHEQRDQLLVTTTTSQQQQQQQQQQVSNHSAHCHNQQPMQVPAHLNQPLTLDLSPKSRSPLNRATPPPSLSAYAPPPNTPLTPPSSSGSSSSMQHGAELMLLAQAAENKRAQVFQPSGQMSQMILSQVLSNYQHCDWATS